MVEPSRRTPDGAITMNKPTVIFLILLGVATLASTQLWAQAEEFINAQGTLTGALLGILSSILLAFTLLVLGRMVYRTALAQRELDLRNQQENNHG